MVALSLPVPHATLSRQPMLLPHGTIAAVAPQGIDQARTVNEPVDDDDSERAATMSPPF